MNNICLFITGLVVAAGFASSARAHGPGPKGAVCPMRLVSAPGQTVDPRQKVVTMILKTIPRFAQTDTVIPFPIFVKILDDPSLFGELLAALDGNELEQSVRAMNRAHQAFDVPIRSGVELPWYSEDYRAPGVVRGAVEYFPKKIVEDFLELANLLEPNNPFWRMMRVDPEARLANRDLLAREFPALLQRHGLDEPGSTLHAYHAVLNEIVRSPEFEGFRKRYRRFLKYVIAHEGGVSFERRKEMMKLSSNALRRFYRGFGARRLEERQRAEIKNWFFWWPGVI